MRRRQRPHGSTSRCDQRPMSARFNKAGTAERETSRRGVCVRRCVPKRDEEEDTRHWQHIPGRRQWAEAVYRSHRVLREDRLVALLCLLEDEENAVVVSNFTRLRSKQRKEEGSFHGRARKGDPPRRRRTEGGSGLRERVASSDRGRTPRRSPCPLPQRVRAPPRWAQQPCWQSGARPFGHVSTGDADRPDDSPAGRHGRRGRGGCSGRRWRRASGRCEHTIVWRVSEALRRC